MDVSRSSSFTILYGGRSLLSPSYYLLRWTRKLTDVATYCICVNTGNEAGPILLEVTETGATIADPFDAEVQLASRDYFLEVWEQTSSTNLFPPDTEPDFAELVRVANSPLPPPTPVDPCTGCPGVICDDATVELNGIEVADVPSGDTVDIPVLQNGSPVGSWNGTQFIIPACPTFQSSYWRSIALGT